MKRQNLIRLRVCPDVRADQSTPAGQWHEAWRKAGASWEVCAFYLRGERKGWVRCEPWPDGAKLFYGFGSKEEALA